LRSLSVLDHRGFTLIEILVGLGLMVLALSLGVGFLRDSFSSEIRNVSRQVAAMARYAHHHAMLEQRTYRIVFNINEGLVRVEAGPEDFTLDLTEFTETDKKDKDTQTSKRGDSEEAEPPPSFQRAESKQLSQYQIPDVVKVASIETTFTPDPWIEGQMALYFFPSGLTQQAIIVLSDENAERFVSLVFYPTTARVRMEPESLRLSDFFGKPSDV
jgi:prepilin-type N-terminal cleavage/methylation domain-containing protein